MTTLIVGLGNPGPGYFHTRHNLGFLILDSLQEYFGAPKFQPDQKFLADTTDTLLNGEKVILAKPMTFMNQSGRSVRALLDYYKLTPASLIVIHDDLDIAPGTLRTTDSSRAAGHNGVQNIIDTLGTQDFFRIRIGIGRPVKGEGVCIPSRDYVLGRFSTEELTAIISRSEEVIKIIQAKMRR